jgi:hypothetical protein
VDAVESAQLGHLPSACTRCACSLSTASPPHVMCAAGSRKSTSAGDSCPGLQPSSKAGSCRSIRIIAADALASCGGVGSTRERRDADGAAQRTVRGLLRPQRHARHRGAPSCCAVVLPRRRDHLAYDTDAVAASVHPEPPTARRIRIIRNRPYVHHLHVHRAARLLSAEGAADNNSRDGAQAQPLAARLCRPTAEVRVGGGDGVWICVFPCALVSPLGGSPCCAAAGPR